MTLDEVKEYLVVDFDDDNLLIQDLIEIAEIYVDECVGENYKKDNKLIKIAELLKKKLIKDMYEKREGITNAVQRDRIAETILNKLSLEA